MHGRAGDRTAAILLLIITGVLAAALAFAGLLLVMSTDSCGSSGANDCDTGLFTIAWLLSMAFPIAGYVATLVVTIAKLAGSTRAWTVPLLGFLIYGAGFAASVALAFYAVG